AISSPTCSSALASCSASGAVRIPWRASMRAWAMLPRTSSRNSAPSTSTDAEKRSMRGSVPPSKRARQIFPSELSFLAATITLEPVENADGPGVPQGLFPYPLGVFGPLPKPLRWLRKSKARIALGCALLLGLTAVWAGLRLHDLEERVEARFRGQ